MLILVIDILYLDEGTGQLNQPTFKNKNCETSLDY